MKRIGKLIEWKESMERGEKGEEISTSWKIISGRLMKSFTLKNSIHTADADATQPSS